ncbi:unnamed protein product [Cunninghamella echinulata]
MPDYFSNSSSEEDNNNQVEKNKKKSTTQVERHISTETFGEHEIKLLQDVIHGCGGKTWEAAYVMINYILWKEKQTSFLKDKTVLDLGSGTGLVGLAIAKTCPQLSHMELTDQIPLIGLLEENIKLNELDHKVGASVLNWGEPNDLKVDIVLASDCVYLEIAFQPLVDTLVTLTDNNHDVQIYLSYRKRRKADKRFFQLLKKKFNIIDVIEDPERVNYSRQSLYLYKLERKW